MAVGGGPSGPRGLDVRPFAGGVSLVAMMPTAPASCTVAEPAFAPGRPIIEVARALCRRHPRAVRLRPLVHRSVDAVGHRARREEGGVPGLRPPGDRCPAHVRPAGALRERLHRVQRRARRRVPMLLMHGVRCGLDRSVGSTSIRRTGTCRSTATSRSRGAATTAMSRRYAGSSSARRRRSNSTVAVDVTRL